MNGLIDINNVDGLSEGEDRSRSLEHGEASTSQDVTNDIMPTDDVILREFEEFLEVGSHTEEEEAKLRQNTIEEKWKMVFNQPHKETMYSAKMYIDNLRKHTGTMRRSSASLRKGNSDGPSSLSHWLRKLKMDLKKSPGDFVDEFIQNPNGGMSVLADILKQIQKDHEKLQSIRKSKAEHLKHVLLDEYDCLLCMKFALKSKDSVPPLLEYNGIVDTIALCLLSTFRKTTTVVLEILTLICDVPSGFLHVTDAITMLRVKTMESVRFKLLANMLHSATNRHFQAVSLRFFNKLLACTDNANVKVFLQHELELAGFEPDSLDRYSLGQSSDFDELLRELDIWRKNYINVDTYRQDLYDAHNRSTLLRQEIDRQQETYKELEEKCKKEEKARQSAESRVDKLREQTAEFQDMLGRLTKLYKDHVGVDPTEEIENLGDFYKPLDGFATVRDNKFNTVSSASSRTLNSIDAVAIPPAPPVLPPAYLSVTIRRKVDNHVNLPTLNWTPMYSVRNTMFEDIDDEAKLRDIDFSEFNRHFQLPIREVESRDRGDRIQQRSANLLTFVENSRARNLIITTRKTTLSHVQLKEAVDKCLVDKLSGESAELLLKFIPTKEEFKLLAHHAHEYHKMGEAEKYLFQMTKVDRLERKLSLIAFIGKFDDIINSIHPEIEVIQRASESLLRSIKLKKVFEILLAFGNYMNSMKKGYAIGFKLESLSKIQEVKSGDKTQTLLHYLVRYIEHKYPELTDFADELDLCVEKGTSYQSVASDVLGLRKGMELLRFEMDKQQHNLILADFHRRASGKVVETADRFRKMEEIYKNNCTYFGEDYKQIDPDELVKYISDFVAAFKRAIIENYKRDHPEAPSTPFQRSKSEANADHKEASTQIPTPRSRSTTDSGSITVSRTESTPAQHDRKRDSVTVKRSETVSTSHSNDNLNTPSKSKPTTSKSIDASEKNDGAVNASIAQHSENSGHVTKIKVMEEKSVQRLGAGQYSELPIVDEVKMSQQPFSIRKASATSDDIRIPDSHSFFYGAKTKDKDPIYAKVRKTPSMNIGNTQPIKGSSSLKRTPTAPPSSNVQMVVRRYPEPSDSIQNSPDTNESRERSSSVKPLPKDPVYEDIPAAHVPARIVAPKLPNGIHKVNSESDSVTTSSLSSMSTTPITTPSYNSDNSSLRKTYPITRVNGLPDTPEDSYDLVDSAVQKNKVMQESIFYKQQVDDAIDSLNQVLDAADTDAVAEVTEDSYL